MDDYRDLGERVLMLGRMTARGKGTGVAVDAPAAAIIDFRDGMVSRVRLYVDHGEASRAAGLTEQAMSQENVDREGIEINGVAHVILRVHRIADCIAFYDRLMPFLGLRAVSPRSDDFVYYVGGRTALAIRRADTEHAHAEHVETAPGIDHLCFRARRREDVDIVYVFLRDIGADIVRAPEEGPWAPGYYSVSFRDPEGIRLELNHVPGEGLMADGSTFDPAPDHPLSGRDGA